MFRKKKWFYDRIGKRIYSDETCEPSKEKDGYIVKEEYADYLYGVQCSAEDDGIDLNFRDNY